MLKYFPNNFQGNNDVLTYNKTRAKIIQIFLKFSCFSSLPFYLQNLTIKYINTKPIPCGTQGNIPVGTSKNESNGLTLRLNIGSFN